MIFNKKNIKEHKGRLVCITYAPTEDNIHSINGIISANMNSLIIFRQKADGVELPILYKDIIEIKESIKKQ